MSATALPPTTFLGASLLVALGGGFGAWLRFATGRLIGHSALPLGTFTVNVIGSLAMGLLAGWLARHGASGSGSWRLLLAVGVLGGFTTFSAFSLELALMIERGELAGALAYALLSLGLGVGALFAGLMIARAL